MSFLVEPNPAELIVDTNSITTTSFTVEWTYPDNDGGAALDGATVTVTAMDNFAEAFTETSEFGVSDTSYEVSGLEPLTIYNVSIVVNNVVQDSVGSSNVTSIFVETLPDRKELTHTHTHYFYSSTPQSHPDASHS